MDAIFSYRNPETNATVAGRLNGMTVALPPDIAVAGWPADAASHALYNYIAPEDATIVQRLRQAGAHLCGYTRTSEFGFGFQASQVGEAVRRNVASVELVLDLMGESRMAAQYAAVCGFKPSYGLISRFGIIGLIPSMECCGILSRSVPVIRDVFQAISGSDAMDFSLPELPVPDYSPTTVQPCDISFGFIPETLSCLTEEQKAQYHNLLAVWQKAGFNLLEISLPEYSLFSLVHKIVGSVEASSCAGRYDSVRYGHRVPGAKNWNDMYLLSRGAAFGTLLKSYLFQGAFFQFERFNAYEHACRIRARLVAAMQEINKRVDLLVLPLVRFMPSGETVSLDAAYAAYVTTVFANVTGQPVLYLPLLADSLVGVQLAGPRLSDVKLMAIGEFLLNLHKGDK